MFARRIVSCAPTRKYSQRWHISARRQAFSAQAGNLPSTTAPPSCVPAVQALASELDKLAPRIDVSAAQIEVIQEPKDFYRALLSKIKSAKRRIYLATLYVGPSEHELLNCLREAVKTNPSLRVSILVDGLRGTREDPGKSCAFLLSKLAAEYPDQVDIRLYHTPNLTGVRKRLIPKRLNEGWGLQHMKLYGIDDDVILSGANLSKEYFTNRQDRYHCISSRTAADFFETIHHIMCSMSYQLAVAHDSSYQLVWPHDNACRSPLEDPQGFVDQSRALFEPFSQPADSAKSPLAPGMARIYPVLVIPQAINSELPALQTILDPKARSIYSYMFTAGYFNPHPEVTASLLATAKPGAKATVVTASPWANGFYGSSGVSGMLPAAYTLLSRRFLQSAARIAPGAVELREWRCGTVGRPHGWTYHAKGLWLTFDVGLRKAGEKATDQIESIGPCVTIVGSSNYTVRSYSLDAEVGAIILTNDPALRSRYRREQEHLLQHSRAVSEEDLRGGERKVGPLVRVAMWIVRAIGGSL